MIVSIFCIDILRDLRLQGSFKICYIKGSILCLQYSIRALAHTVSMGGNQFTYRIGYVYYAEVGWVDTIVEV